MKRPPAAPVAVPRVVELVRVSTQGQADRDTPEVQRRALDSLRVHRPGTVIERIEAPGVSGALSLKDRPDLQRLAALSAARAFDELRVYSIDRLTRAADPRERMAVYGMALDAEALIVDARGHTVDPRSEMGELDFYLQTLFASRERQKIRQRTGDGRRRALADGRLSQGQPPYGRRYNRERRAWELNESEAAVYRQIVDAVLAGRTTRQIAATLNARGVRPTRASRWAHSTIKRLLHTEAIVGRYRVAGTAQAIPAIVDEATWAAIRATLRKGATRSGPTPTRPALLRKLLRCAHCGRRLRVHAYGAGGPTSYICAREGDAKPCPNRTAHRTEEVDAAMRSALIRLASSPAAMRRALAGAAKPADVATARAEAEKARRDLAAATKREASVLRLLDVLSPEAARTELRAVAETRNAAAEALREAEARVAAAERGGGDAEAVAARLRTALAEAGDEALRELLEALLPKGVSLSAEGEIRGLVLAAGSVSNWS